MSSPLHISKQQTQTSCFGGRSRSAEVFFKTAFTLKGIQMQNSVNTVAASTSITEAIQNAMPTTVVVNDTSNGPSIKLSEMSVPVTITVGTNAPVVVTNKLAVLENARKSWEGNELAASNKRLYSILYEVYGYYLNLKKHDDKDVRKKVADEMEQFISQRGYSFMPSTHDMTRVVKCVFGVDRRRVSAYSIALREALRQEVSAADLITFIEENGGVEQIRLGGTKPLSVTKRAGIAKEEVLSNELGTFKFDPELCPADSDWADKQVVIVATYLPTGEFQANAVIRHDSAVNAALAAFYSLKQAQQREVSKTEREAAKATDAAYRKALREQKKLANAEKKTTNMQTAIEQKKQQDEFSSHFNTLFETTQA
jgi:hypothetical protein